MGNQKANPLRNRFRCAIPQLAPGSRKPQSGPTPTRRETRPPKTPHIISHESHTTIILATLTQLEPLTPENRAYRSAWMIALMGLLRTSEFLIENGLKPDRLRLLSIQDVEWHPNRHNPKWITIHIRASKTDFWRQGVRITIGVTGCPDFCAVTELRLALEQRYPGTTKWDPKAPLFLTRGHPLTKRRSSAMLKFITHNLGWNSEEYGYLYSHNKWHPHTNYSFRKGGASSIAWKVPLTVLKAMGRWKSDAYQYARCFEIPKLHISTCHNIQKHETVLNIEDIHHELIFRESRALCNNTRG